jgi:CBS domain containing-hemolysin-like protein
LDESSLVSSLVLAASLLTFTYISLGENLPDLRDHHLQSFPSLGFLRLVAFLAVATSTVSLFLSLGWMTWPWFTLLSLGLIVLMFLLDWGATYLAHNHPGMVQPLVSPMRRIFKSTSEDTSSLQADGVPLVSGNGAPNGLGHSHHHVEGIISPEEQATLDERERSMIRSILRLDEFNARDIMVPRMDIVAVEVTEDLSDVAQRMLDSGHSRLPVYRDTLDSVVGIIHSRDMLPLLSAEGPWPSLENLLKEPFFVPEAKRLDELLPEFQHRRVQLALVVDEHGGIEGLVTLEDLLEEIVGEIEDEFSKTTEPQIRPTEDGKLIVDARISLNDLEEFVPLTFEEAEVDTVGGLVYTKLGKMPQAGDEVVYNGLRIKVLSTVGRRLGKLQLFHEAEEDGA